MDTPVLAVEQLNKRYGKTWAIRDVTLNFPTGSVTGLVGPNGAGKSTLLKCFMAFERPTSGRALVRGVNPTVDRKAALSNVSYLGQTPSLYRELTVTDHLDLLGHLRHGRFDRATALNRITTLGIDVSARCGILSGGQAAQVGLAMALATRSEALLLDEPLASLDPLARRDFIDLLLDDVRESGRTVVMSSHVVSDIELACDRLVVLGGGEVILHDTIRSIVDARLGNSEPIQASASEPARNTGPGGARSTSILEEIVIDYLGRGRTGR
jgi:ABC-type multidrug transport system, ATPase component